MVRFSVSSSLGIAALTAALALPAAPAAAQVPIETAIQKPAANRAKVQPKRVLPERVEIEEPEAERESPPSEQDPGEGEATEDGTANAAPPGTRIERSLTPTASDLDAARPTADGTVKDGELSRALQDGVSDLERDVRLRRDRDAFEAPPAGYDALAFQIEQIDPLADRRTDRLFRLEPYDPLGVRIGSFVLFPEVEAGLLTNSNLFRAPNAVADWAPEIRSSLRFVSDWSRHAVELRASTRNAFYENHGSENDDALTLEARGRLDVSRRTFLEAAVQHLADKDTRSLIDAPTNAAQRGNIATDRVAGTFGHRFGRASVQVRAAVAEVTYDDVAAVNGAIISNAARSYTQDDWAFRFAYALNRHASVFTEVARRDRDYAAAPGDGLRRSSTSDRYRLGMIFSPLGPSLRGEVSVGWGWQAPKAAGLPDMQGVLVDASLAWKASALTTFLLTVRSDFYDTTAANSPGTLSREVGLEMRHAFRRNLIASLGAKYAISPYTGLSLDDRLFTGEAGLDYHLNPRVSVYGRYQHLEFTSTDTVRDYAADVVRVGLRVRQ